MIIVHFCFGLPIFSAFETADINQTPSGIAFPSILKLEKVNADRDSSFFNKLFKFCNKSTRRTSINFALVLLWTNLNSYLTMAEADLGLLHNYYHKALHLGCCSSHRSASELHVSLNSSGGQCLSNQRQSC